MPKDISEPRKGLVIKHTPVPIIRLREELALPSHADIAAKAMKGADFAECLGIIAAELGIALDGEYDVQDLCIMLLKALRNRKNVDKEEPHKLADGLVPVKMEETEDALRLEHAKLPAAKTADEATVTKHNIFMLEHGCQICDDREACIAAQKCLDKKLLH